GLDDAIDITINEKSKSILDDKFTDDDFKDVLEDDPSLWMTSSFNDFEDVIQLSHYFQSDAEEDVVTVLYHHDNKYYLYVELSPSLIDEQEDILSQVLEYSHESDMTYHFLDEYGQVIIDKNVFTEIKK